MSRISPVDRNTTHEPVRRHFDAIEKLLGVVPNMMRTMAQSPAVLEGYLAFSGALRRGTLPASLQEQLALVVAEANECDYCLSAHTVLGVGAGLTHDQIAASREGRATDAKAVAALQFAITLLDRRGHVSQQELAEVRSAGFSDGAIAEIVANVAINIFTNYFNRAVETDIDFPAVHAHARPTQGVLV